LSFPANAQQEKSAPSEPATVQPSELGDIYNLHQCGNLLMAGQPTPEDFALLKEQGIQCVVTFRTEDEIDWDEQAAVEAAGMDFKAIRYGTLDSLTDDVFAASRKLLRENKNQPILLHCGAAVRVAAVWLTYRVLDEGVELEQALAEAQKIGLRSKALRERAVRYIEEQQQQR
jgi:uncharacterized protein (TIGR01244 family)